MKYVALAALCLAAQPTPAAAQVASMSTSQATILQDARTVFIESVQVPEDALVMVRAVRNGRIDRLPLGHARVGPGKSTHVRVGLARETRAGESLVVMLHADFGRKGIYDGDPVVLSVDISEDALRDARIQGGAAKP